MGTSCTEAEAAGVAVVSRIEVFPLPGPIPVIGAKKCQIKIHCAANYSSPKKLVKSKCFRVINIHISNYIPVGPTELWVFIVNGNEVGGLIIVVAVARGTVPAVRGVPLAGGVLVNTVTLLFMTAKFTCCCWVVAFGTANNGGRETGPLRRLPPDGWLGAVPKMATGPEPRPPELLGGPRGPTARFKLGLGTVGIRNGCLFVVTKSTG